MLRGFTDNILAKHPQNAYSTFKQSLISTETHQTFPAGQTFKQRNEKQFIQLTRLFQMQTLWAEITAKSERSLLYLRAMSSPQCTSFELKYFGHPIGKYILAAHSNPQILTQTRAACPTCCLARLVSASAAKDWDSSPELAPCPRGEGSGEDRKRLRNEV